MKIKLLKFTLLALATSTVISACSAPPAFRDEVAYRLASPAEVADRVRGVVCSWCGGFCQRLL